MGNVADVIPEDAVSNEMVWDGHAHWTSALWNDSQLCQHSYSEPTKSFVSAGSLQRHILDESESESDYGPWDQPFQLKDNSPVGR